LDALDRALYRSLYFMGRRMSVMIRKTTHKLNQEISWHVKTDKRFIIPSGFTVVTAIML